MAIEPAGGDQGPGLTAGDSVTPAAQQGIQICGPDEIDLLIEPYTEGYVWQIRNGRLGPIGHLRFEIVCACSYDAQKCAFRHPIALRIQWNIKDLPAGEVTPKKPTILIRIEGEHLGLGNTNRMHQLAWPSGDPTELQRWLLNMRIIGPSREWPIELDLRWTVGTKTLEMMQYSDNIPANGSASHTLSRVAAEPASKQEGTVRLFAGQEYPKSMHHASKPPVIVNNAQEQAELGPEWSETYIFQAYPKCKYGWNDKTVTVKDANEEAVLGLGWADSPGAFQPYSGPRTPKAIDKDATRWVDPWSVSGLLSDHRRKIKAQLLRADAAFWRSADTPNAFIDPMRQAFAGIAEVLSKAGILNEQLLQHSIPALVWDSAIAGGWYRAASAEPQNIFPERLGNYWVWRNSGTDWNNLFYAETQEWLAWLLENPAEDSSNPPVALSAKLEEEASSELLGASPKEIVDRCRRDKKLRSYEKLAGRIGISKDTLYAITKETRWLSEQTYELVAQVCNCRPEDLHPRGVPRRKSD